MKKNKMNFQIIAEEIDQLSANFRIGNLQNIRKALGKPNPKTKKIFHPFTIKNNYAFHYGGRREIQFNIGKEGTQCSPLFRFGIAFSFQTNRNLKDISIFEPKIQRYNEFCKGHYDILSKSGLKRWCWIGPKDDRERTNLRGFIIDKAKLFKPGNFIFLGKEINFNDYSPNEVLALFDSLLPLYEYVEG